jgi:hypothetical protein
VYVGVTVEIPKSTAEMTNDELRAEIKHYVEVARRNLDPAANSFGRLVSESNRAAAEALEMLVEAQDGRAPGLMAASEAVKIARRLEQARATLDSPDWRDEEGVWDKLDALCRLADSLLDRLVGGSGKLT